jgi:predicted adenylyl cyclase CyaB
MWQGVRIHLDEVAGLGTFVELEAVMEPDEPDEIGQQKVAVLRERLGITDENLVGVSYSDLLGF